MIFPAAGLQAPIPQMKRFAGDEMAMRALAARYGFEVVKNADLSEIRIALQW
jgi:hypothetical protein